MAAHRAPPSLGFSRQEHWSGLPFLSPMHESEKWKVKSLSRVWLFATLWTIAYQAPLSVGFSRQEYWSGLPFPSPMHESEKWMRSRSVVSNSWRPHGLQPTRLLHPWDFPGKSTGVGCHWLLRVDLVKSCINYWPIKCKVIGCVCVCVCVCVVVKHTQYKTYHFDYFKM